MPLLRSFGFCALVLLAGCHFEDHTPAGSRRDEDQIRAIINEYYRSFSDRDWAACRKFFMPDGRIGVLSHSPTLKSSAGLLPVDSVLFDLARLGDHGNFPPPQAQVLRIDLRQVNGFAAAWVTVRQIVSRNGQPSRLGEDTEHWVLQRTPDGWRIMTLSLPWISM
jgi:hypothetical protein